MDPKYRQHLEELLRSKQERLMALELTAARFGYSAPPEVVTEIAQLRAEIDKIEKELDGGYFDIDPQPSPVTILFLVADPSDATRLRLGEEFREIQEKLQRAKLRDRFTLEPRLSVRPEDFLQALIDVQPQVVHFSGHGTASGALCFENERGQMHPVDAQTLKAVFRKFADKVQCVVLNACYAEIQARAIAEHIEYVVGMNEAIGDRAAIAFASGFYQALGGGRSYEDAYDLGCVHISLLGIPEDLTPVLIRKEEL